MSKDEKTFQEIDLVRLFPEIKFCDIIILKLPNQEYEAATHYNNDDFIQDKITLKLEKK